MMLAAVVLSAVGCSGEPSTGTSPTPSGGQGPIVVEGTWASVAGKRADVYFILSNHGSGGDILTGASSPDASGAVMKHGSKEVASLPLTPGSELSFEAGRYGLTLTGLQRSLQVGDTVRVTLAFRQAEPVTFVAGVR